MRRSSRNPFILIRMFLTVCCFVCIQQFIFPDRSVAGEVKRVAYFEGGPYWIFTHEFDVFQEELSKNERFTVEFPPELHISAGWDKTPEELDEYTAALHARDDIDVLILAGTAAVRSALRTNRGKIPMIGVDVTDPVGSGLVKSADDSGVDNFTCDVVEDRWKRMFSVFYEAIGFTRLGVMYPASPEGKMSTSLSDAEAAAAELGFTLLPYELPGESVEDCAKGIRWLHESGADAMFIGSLNAFDWEQSDPAPLYELLNDTYSMPTFARDGSYQVEGGALMGFTLWNYAVAGARNAGKAMAIFEGASPRSLPLRIDFTPLLAINLQTALKLEIDLPFDILIAADEIFMETSRPQRQEP